MYFDLSHTYYNLKDYRFCTLKMPPRVKKCCVKDCEDVTSIRHRFPIHDENTFYMWIDSINHPRFKTLTLQQIYQTYIVCHRHFAEDCHVQGWKKLRSGSIPTLHLPELPDEINTAAEVISSKTVPVHQDCSNVSKIDTIQSPPKTILKQADYRLLYEYKNNKENELVIETETPIIQPTREIAPAQAEELEYEIENEDETEMIELLETSLPQTGNQKMETNDYSCENICRACLSKEGNLKSVFSIQISDTHLVRMVDFIRRMTSIKIAKGDGLPENLCMCCIETLCKAYTFAQLCISSDNFLRLQRKRLALQNIQNEIFEDESMYTEENDQETCVEQSAECYENEYVSNEVSNNLSADESKQKILKESWSEFPENQAPDEPSTDFKDDKNDLILLKEENVRNGKVEFGEIIFDNDFEIVQEDEIVENEETVKDETKEKTPPPEGYKKVLRNYQLKFQCEECHESFSTSMRLQKHVLLHDSSRPYQCHECFKTFTKKTHLTVHMRSHVKAEDKQHICTVCGQKFVYSYLLKQHSYKHTEEKPYPCSKCNRGCLTAESLRRHMKTHEENYKKKKHFCSVCSKEFPYPSFLAEHMKNHTGEKPFLCSICGRGFRQSGALEYHIRSHTGFKPYTCQICNNSFSSRGVLRVHMRRHTNERPYVCDICGMAFRQSTDMRSHHRTHTGDKRVLCTVCGKRMSTTGQLTVHLRSHTGEKPFGCDICQKAFTTRTMLVKHRRIHTGERPYECNICHRAFNQSSTLKTHMVTHRKKNNSDNTNIVTQKVIIYDVRKAENVIKDSNIRELRDVKNENIILPAPIPML